jgi:hypothetical protein
LVQKTFGHYAEVKGHKSLAVNLMSSTKTSIL